MTRRNYILILFPLACILGILVGCMETKVRKIKQPPVPVVFAPLTFSHNAETSRVDVELARTPPPNLKRMPPMTNILSVGPLEHPVDPLKYNLFYEESNDCGATWHLLMPCTNETQKIVINTNNPFGLIRRVAIKNGIP